MRVSQRGRCVHFFRTVLQNYKCYLNYKLDKGLPIMNLWKSLSLKWKQIAYYLLVGVTPPPGSFLYRDC
jgi:hypothetical protein